MIINNFASVYCIPTKLGTKMWLYTTFSVYQISRQLDNVFELYGNFHTSMKEKNEEIKPNFEDLCLRNAWHNLFKV